MKDSSRYSWSNCKVADYYHRCVTNSPRPPSPLPLRSRGVPLCACEAMAAGVPAPALLRLLLWCCVVVTLCEVARAVKSDVQWSRDPEHLNVFVVPHSHNDPGWWWTYEEYYKKWSKGIISSVVTALDEVCLLRHQPPSFSQCRCCALYGPHLRHCVLFSYSHAPPLSHEPFCAYVDSSQPTGIPPPSLLYPLSLSLSLSYSFLPFFLSLSLTLALSLHALSLLSLSRLWVTLWPFCCLFASPPQKERRVVGGLTRDRIRQGRSFGAKRASSRAGGRTRTLPRSRLLSALCATVSSSSWAAAGS